MLKGDTYDHEVQPVSLAIQDQAIRSILNTLTASELALPSDVVSLIPPTAFGYRRDRETFDSRTNLTFDVLASAESYAHMVCSLMLQSERLARIHRHSIAHNHPMKLDEYLNRLSNYIFNQRSSDPYYRGLEDLVRYVVTSHLIHVAGGKNADPLVAAAARDCLSKIKAEHLQDEDSMSEYLTFVIDKGLNDPTSVEVPSLNDLPPGSPIGCGY